MVARPRARAARGDRGGSEYPCTGLRRCAHSNDRRRRRAHWDDPRRGRRQATAEGCSRSHRAATGYKGVSLHEPAMRHGLEESRYFAQFKGGGTPAPLGYLARTRRRWRTRGTSARRAARRRSPRCRGVGPADGGGGDRGSARRGARARARGERDGYRGVKKNVSGHTKPYEARVRRDGKNEHLGTFACAEAAALAYARRLGPQETGELAARPASVDHRPSRRAARADGAGGAAGPAAGGGRCRHLRSEGSYGPAGAAARRARRARRAGPAAAYRSLAAEAPAPAPAVAAASAAASSATTSWRARRRRRR